MRYAFVAALAAVVVPGAAQSAELTITEVKELITGNSVYMELTAASSSKTPGQGVIYYAADGAALYKTPKNAIWRGSWQIKDNTVCLDWKEAPNNPCTRYEKKGETITFINALTGQVRGKVLSVSTGNTEALARK
jgi:subtilisin family serine protease